MKHAVWWLSLVLTVTILLGCKKSAFTQEPVDYITLGLRVTDDATLGNPGNGYTCVTCHRPVEAERIYPNTQYVAFPFADIASSPKYWDDTLSLRDAVNKCIVTFMRGTPLTSVSDRWIGLQAYMQSVSPDNYLSQRRIWYDSTGIISAGVLDSTAYENLYSGGDTLLGQIAYTRYCIVCHGYGINGATDLSQRSDLSASYIAIRTRLSSTNFLPGGTMPFFPTTPRGDDTLREMQIELTPDTLRNIIAYIRKP